MFADYSSVIELDPEAAWAYNNRAWFGALLNGDLEQALADANMAIELQPSGGRYDTRGMVYYKRGQYEAALQDYNAAINKRTEYAHYGRGLVYEALGETDMAIADFTAFLAAYPDADPESDDARERIEKLGGKVP
jgi:tetratricopeptide (TPR) repeat protein